MSDTIVLYDSVPFFSSYMEKKGVRVFPTFKEIRIVSKLFRKLSTITGVGLPYWYGPWKNHLKGVTKVIVFASNRIDHVKYLRKRNPEARIIYWYWNPAFKCYNPLKIPRDLCELWSFDRTDVDRYSMKFNTTFYFDNIAIAGERRKRSFQVLFVGADKGRAPALFALEDKLKGIGVSTLFHVVPDGTSSINRDIRPIPYNRYLEMVSESDIVVDYIQEGQSGMTLRPLEALFFKKKLITNDASIVESGFYNPANIFVIGIDNINTLKDFVNRPYEVVDETIVKYFDFSSWLNRFNC